MSSSNTKRGRKDITTSPHGRRPTNNNNNGTKHKRQRNLDKFLQETVDGLNKQIPKVLAKNTKLIAALDDIVPEDIQTSDAGKRARTQNVSSTKPSGSTNHLSKEQTACAFLLADLKQELALQSYELLDLAISDLDGALSKLSKAAPGVTVRSGEAGNSTTIKSTERNIGRMSPAPSSSSSSKYHALLASQTKSRKHTTTTTTTTPATTTTTTRQVNHTPHTMSSPATLNMEIDPNEPLFCTCSQVAFGEMIACDNPDCQIEWFHVQCIGGRPPENSKWLCPDCRSKA